MKTVEEKTPVLACEGTCGNGAAVARTHEHASDVGVHKKPDGTYEAISHNWRCTGCGSMRRWGLSNDWETI